MEQELSPIERIAIKWGDKYREDEERGELPNPKLYMLDAINEATREVRSRLNWAANELLACDYGDNDRDEIGWIVFGWRDVNGIHSVVPFDKVRRIYGASIDAAIDAALAKVRQP